MRHDAACRAQLILAVAWLLGRAWVVGGPSQAEAPPHQARRFAIVVTKETVQNAGWKGVVEALREKHSAEVFHPGEGGLEGLKEKLGAFRPHYVCFVMRPEELAREARARLRSNRGRAIELPLCGIEYHRMGELIRSLDPDPYYDAIWAVLTAASPQDALRVVGAKPLVVRRHLSHITSGWLEWFESGVSFDETKKGRKYVKVPGKPPVETRGPDDTTAEFIRELNSGTVDMVSTSGHATEGDWQMGFTYRNGQLVTASRIARLAERVRENYRKLLEGSASLGKLFGVDTAGRVLPVLSRNPKVYYSPGNCRIARVAGRDCMVLGWIHHGAMQFFGHVGLQTRSCYAWGVAEYFLALQGRFTFAEAVWANQQALRWELTRPGQRLPREKYLCCRDETCLPAQGKLFWETTVLYGDPAWEARVKRVTDPLYEQTLRTEGTAQGQLRVIFEAKMLRASRPSRPAVFILERPLGSVVRVVEGPSDLVVADDFALVPFWQPGAPSPKVGQRYRAVVVVQRASPKSDNARHREKNQ